MYIDNRASNFFCLFSVRIYVVRSLLRPIVEQLNNAYRISRAHSFMEGGISGGGCSYIARIVINAQVLELVGSESKESYHDSFLRLRWSSGCTRTTRSRSFFTTLSLFLLYESVIDWSLTWVSWSIAAWAVDVTPACYTRASVAISCPVEITYRCLKCLKLLLLCLFVFFYLFSGLCSCIL